ncbi:MAG: hypothetical protein EBU07_19745 [Betaproteobacteria bacterium]|nr:hypothetical protein [Betaproteobacteria bacterium]
MLPTTVAPTSTITNGPNAPGAVRLGQGDEMGRFLLGSTVVMLFPKNTIAFNPAWVPAGAIRMGEAMGHTI